MLNSDDLQQIRGVVEEVVNAAEERIVTTVRGEIQEAVQASEERIVGRMHREITDLAEINQAVIDKWDNHETRIVTIEHKLELKSAA